MKPRLRGHRRRRHIEREVELNITSFMNLMVVLVPFLLTTAVFSRVSALTIDVPTPVPPGETAMPPPPPEVAPFRLAVRLEKDGVVVVAGKDTLPPVPRTADGAYDTAVVNARLAEVKKAHPEHTAIDILSRPDTPYEDLVAVMDADGDRSAGTLLFADIRLGEIFP